MAKYIIQATKTIHYEAVEVEATSEMEALESIKEWIADDFSEDYAVFDFEVIGEE